MNPTLIKGYRADMAIAPYRLVAYSSDEGGVIQATHAAAAMIGVSDSLGADEGSMCDVIRRGIAEIEYAADIAYGDPLTCDAEGRAVVAGAGESYVARAEHDGDAGVIGHVWLEVGVVPAAAG